MEIRKDEPDEAYDLFRNDALIRWRRPLQR